MRLFDVLGPVMTGPSSSHTAGAVRIGLTARNLLGEAPKTAEILLHGSFAATGRGHGTDRALVAGLLGMLPDDERIPDSFSLAQQAGLVEIPCIKRNVIGAMNAVSCADMALAGVVGHIPADEVIDAMAEVGAAMSNDLRETGIGGLAGTPTGKAIRDIVQMQG